VNVSPSISHSSALTSVPLSDPGVQDEPVPAGVARLPLAGVAAARADGDELEQMVRNFDVTTTAFIPKGLTIKGGLDTEGSAAVVIFGNVQGPVNTGDKPVYVMNGATVAGSINTCGEVVVAGAVGGDASSGEAVRTSGRFSLAATGRVKGDVFYRSLRVYEGGMIDGRLLPDTPKT
jgi:cytoskeletal protein CcmA (bactofilin family)